MTARPADITRAMRGLYPHGRMTCRALPEAGAFLLRMPYDRARYWGAWREPGVAAAWLSRRLGYHAEITAAAPACGGDALVTLRLTAGAIPADPGTAGGAPRYETVDQVIGDFPANRPARQLIQLALDAGLLPHLAPDRSPHSRSYRVLLGGEGRDSLFGVFDVGEQTGRFTRAWLVWGAGPERQYAGTAQVRQQLTSYRDLRASGGVR